MKSILPATVADYLAGHHVLTLATQGRDGPWAAAVFYALDGAAPVFLSSPETRHCRNLALDPRCAASIQDDCADWRLVRGLQLDGRVRELAGAELERGRAIYAAKFPQVGPDSELPESIRAAFARVRWFRFEPELIRFIDNSRGFGHREEFRRPAPT